MTTTTAAWNPDIIATAQSCRLSAAEISTHLNASISLWCKLTLGRFPEFRSRHLQYSVIVGWYRVSNRLRPELEIYFGIQIPVTKAYKFVLLSAIGGINWQRPSAKSIDIKVMAQRIHRQGRCDFQSVLCLPEFCSDRVGRRRIKSN